MIQQEKDLDLIKIIGFDRWLDYSIKSAKISIEIFVHNRSVEIIHDTADKIFYNVLLIKI